ncbi:hypothetical protein BJ978_002220 [Agromyces terreus]|uniref:Uncharacterized protein n=1 Tax=Agromyces terreus TaxID=424795 RepID=A0A9X2KCE2_9MICO|nr:hypothetical protein [Agromyces terreus]MCP2371544.1 hypothetical protein [Agromyces terreus]
MSTATLSPASGVLAAIAVNGGLKVAEWGLRRAARRSDPDRVRRRIEARKLAEAALAERDAMIRSSVAQLF